MDRLVEIKVKYGTAASDSKFIGVVGDAFITAMRVTFDADWDGFAKTLTMWDARGQNPVAVILGANLLEDVAVGNVYLVPIPAEPLAYQGDGIAAVFEGTKTLDGVTTVQRTENLYFTVLEAYLAQGAGAPSDVTPTQAEQLQSEIDALLPSLQADVTAAQAAHDGAEGALTAAEWAQAAAEDALSGAAAAKDGALAAKGAAEAAAGAALGAKSAIEAMSATVSGLPAGSAPSVTKSTAAGVTNLAFEIPEGEQGEQGPRGYSVAEVVKTSGTGAAGTIDTYAVKLNDAAMTVAGTFSVQNGADGEGAGDMLASLYDSNGDGVVNDADKLGGQPPAYYVTGAGLAAHTGRTDNPHGVTAAQAGAAAASHTHAASAITSGTLPVARGGTGQTSVDSAPTSGSSKMVTSGGIYTALSDLAPKVGELKITPENDLGANWLLCNGDTFTQAEYPELFDVIQKDNWELDTTLNYNLLGVYSNGLVWLAIYSVNYSTFIIYRAAGPRGPWTAMTVNGGEFYRDPVVKFINNTWVIGCWGPGSSGSAHILYNTSPTLESAWVSKQISTSTARVSEILYADGLWLAFYSASSLTVGFYRCATLDGTWTHTSPSGYYTSSPTITWAAKDAEYFYVMNTASGTPVYRGATPTGSWAASSSWLKSSDNLPVYNEADGYWYNWVNANKGADPLCQIYKSTLLAGPWTLVAEIPYILDTLLFCGSRIFMSVEVGPTPYAYYILTTDNIGCIGASLTRMLGKVYRNGAAFDGTSIAYIFSTTPGVFVSDGDSKCLPEISIDAAYCYIKALEG